MRLTIKMLQAMSGALQAALAGDGFDGGDFDGEDPDQYEKAAEWVGMEIDRRQQKSKARVPPK